MRGEREKKEKRKKRKRKKKTSRCDNVICKFIVAN
jgi:hypothetical protein